MAVNQVSSIMPSSFRTSLDSGGLWFWALTIFLSVVIPPLGITLATYLVIRATKNPQKAHYLLIVLIVIMAALAGTAAYVKIYSSLYNGKYKHTYSKLDAYKLPGKQNGLHDAVTFMKPAEFVPIANNDPTTKLTAATLAHSISVGASKKSLASIVVSSTSDMNITNNGSYPDYIKFVDVLLQEHQGAGFDSFKKPLQQYLQTVTSKDYEINLNTPTALHTPNIAKDAWEFDFTAKSKTNANGYRTGQTIEDGKLILAFGDNTYYYFVIDSVDYNWHRNQVVWQQVIDSIKIDQ